MFCHTLILSIAFKLKLVQNNVLFFSPIIVVKSRVLMSLRGEQDDWYEFYGPNIPHSNYERKEPAEKAPAPEPVSYGPVLNEAKTGTADKVLDMNQSNSSENKLEVVAVTVDGRFGQVSNASDGENIKGILPADAEQIIRIESRVEGSADAIEV